MTNFGMQLFTAMMTAGVDRKDLPDATPKAKQHRHCPKCNSINIITGMKRVPSSDEYGLWLRCENCGMEKQPLQKDWK